ncbi:MAG: anti-sigma factor family protein [Steroidobacteraceae bacterium]
MTFSDDVLMAYADGELDLRTRAQVEDAMATDPQIARRVAAHQATRSILRSGFDKVLDEPIPERLIAAARAAPGATSQDRVVVPLGPRRARSLGLPQWALPQWTLPQWGAVAASFVLGALVWHFGTDWYSSGPITERDGGLFAAGTLDKALSNQLVSEQPAQSPVQIGVSFRVIGGSYCRTFQLRENTNLAGLACRDQDKWRLKALAQSEASPPGTHPQFRPAGSALPPSIAQAVDQVIDGEPLDATAEAHARTNQWRVPQ